MTPDSRAGRIFQSIALMNHLEEHELKEIAIALMGLTLNREAFVSTANTTNKTAKKIEAQQNET